MTSVNIEFLLHIQELRTAKKLTEQQMANALKISGATCSKKELGFFSSNLSEIVVIARLFEMSVSEPVIPLSPTISEVYPPP